MLENFIKVVTPLIGSLKSLISSCNRVNSNLVTEDNTGLLNYGLMTTQITSLDGDAVEFQT